MPLRHGCFTRALLDVKCESVDLILTDPPYGKEFLHTWTQLGLFASRVLKSDGLLVAYTGQMYLPRVMSQLEQHLSYLWTIAVVYTGAPSYIRNAGISQSWKPILLFTRQGYKRKGDDGIDVIQGAGEEKDLHIWQQPEAEAASLVSRFSKPWDMVVDPFVGSGTTGVAALKLGRRFLGCDIDEAALATARKRLSEVINHASIRG